MMMESGCYIEEMNLNSLFNCFSVLVDLLSGDSGQFSLQNQNFESLEVGQISSSDLFQNFLSSSAFVKSLNQIKFVNEVLQLSLFGFLGELSKLELGKFQFLVGNNLSWYSQSRTIDNGFLSVQKFDDNSDLSSVLSMVDIDYST